MHAVLTLYDTPPKDGRGVCVDESAPLNLQPRKGKTWRGCRDIRPGCAPRSTATTGCRLPGALDLATGRLYYRIRGRKRWREFLCFSWGRVS